MKKKVTYNTDYKTVIFDYDGTMFDTDAMQQVSAASLRTTAFGGY